VSDPTDERARLEEQTARNLLGMERERAGDLDGAIALYEENLREGFEADFPYGRLVSIYGKQGRFDEAVRVLERGIQVFAASRRRTSEDRRAVIAIFRNRLREERRNLRASQREAARRERAAQREAARQGKRSSSDG
jgi:tetratricopeptide (TPR) repeat protein